MRLARSLAMALHLHQKDKAGAPYFAHLDSVVGRLLTMFPDVSDEEIDAAYLHDVIEDCGVTSAQLLDMGVRGGAIRIIEAVTKPDPCPDYLDWIRSIAASGNVSAIRVKIADNADNLSPERVAALGDDRLARNRYEPARAILLAALE